MAVKLGQEVCVTMPTDASGDEEIRAYFPPYDDAKMLRAVKKLMSSRMKQRRGMLPKDRTAEARVEFFDETCLRVENVEYPVGDGTYAPLTSDVEGWRDKIPDSWKASFASNFEEKVTLTESDRKN